MLRPRRKLAAIVHLNAFVRVTPLAGGYLKAYAQAMPEVRSDWDIELLNFYVRTPASVIIRELLNRQPDVVAFSTYTWNGKLVSRLLPPLLGLLPAARFLVGGVEVVGRGAAVMQPSWENVAICNGEGERTFREFLLQAGAERPDLSAVKGLSYYRDGQLITTENHERIRDLGEIPSPWLTDLFEPDDLSEIVLFETNRGCPFACEFCFWGGAIGQQVNKLELERLQEEITYIGRNRGKTLSLCDANFGLTKNDVAIAEHIVATKERYGFPLRVTFSTAKNNKNSIVEISNILHRNGLISEQAISLQSMNKTALDTAKRGNIRLDVYTSLQRNLNASSVASYIELIWPLPGETLDSFKDGLQRLCESGAHAFWIYPLLWLNNVGFASRAEELGVVTIEESDPDGAAPMVITTREVSYDEYLQGLHFATAVLLLFTCRGLYVTLNVFNRLGIARFQDLFDAFVEWMAAERDDPISSAWTEGGRQFEEMNKWAWRGFLVHAIFHEHRAVFDELLGQFYQECLRPRAESSGHRELADAAFEFDILSRPYLFVQTPMTAGIPLLETVIRERRRCQWLVTTQYDFPAMIEAFRTDERPFEDCLERGPRQIEIDHSAGLIFRLASKVDQEHYWHCTQVMRGMGNFEPQFSVAVTQEYERSPVIGHSSAG